MPYLYHDGVEASVFVMFLRSFIQIFTLICLHLYRVSVTLALCLCDAHRNTHLERLGLCHSVKGINGIQPQAQDDILPCSVKMLFDRGGNRQGVRKINR